MIANIDEPEPGIYSFDSICDCDQDSKSRLDGDETRANAKLIAAAPELYAALFDLLCLVMGECPAILENDHHDTIVREALAKARGER